MKRSLQACGEVKYGALTLAVAAGVREGGQARDDGGSAHGARPREAALAARGLFQYSSLCAVVADVGQVAGRQRVHLVRRDRARPLLQQLVALCPSTEGVMARSCLTTPARQTLEGMWSSTMGGSGQE